MKIIKIGRKYETLVDNDIAKWIEQTNTKLRAYPRKHNIYIFSITHGTNLSRLIMQLEKGNPSVVDHKNHNVLDNRRVNLRVCSQSQNLCNRRVANSTGFKGVTHHRNRFYARVQFNGKCIYAGNCSTAEQAAKAYDKKAKEIYGEFAFTNFPI